MTDQNCKSGKQCVLMESTDARGPQPFGNFMQGLDATPYRGKHVTLPDAVPHGYASPLAML